MKTVLKVIYVVFIGVMAFIVYFGMNSTYVSQNYINALKEASEKASTEKQYDDLASCFSLFSTPIDKEKVVFADQNGQNATSVYASVNQFNCEYTNSEGKNTKVNRVEKVYLFIIYNPTFQYADSASGVNKSAFRLYGENGEYYDYNFTVSSTVNSDKYVSGPTNEKDASLKAERHLLTEYKDYNLIFFPLTESHIKYIKEESGIDTITGVNIIDNNGVEVYKDTDFTTKHNLDFNQQFYTDMSLWLDYIKIYMEYQEGKEFDNIETVVEYINGFTENPNNYVSNFDNLYFRGIPREKVYTGFEPVIKAIGVAALFVLVGVILYFILFHLKWIRNFVKRFSKKAEPERKVPNKMPKEQIVISKSSVNKEPKALDTPKEEVVEEPIVEEAPVEETPSNEDDSTEEETTVLDTKEETEENE